MRRGDTEELIGLLAGELPPAKAAAQRARLAREPDLAAALRRLETAWRTLEPPPAGPVPAGFGREVMARVRREAEGPAALSWSLAPVWVRAAGAVALAAGVLLGAGVGTLRQVTASGAGEMTPAGLAAKAGAGRPAGDDLAGGEAAGDDAAPELLAPSLAEEYLEAVGGEGSGAADPLAGWGDS